MGLIEYGNLTRDDGDPNDGDIRIVIGSRSMKLGITFEGRIIHKCVFHKYRGINVERSYSEE